MSHNPTERHRNTRNTQPELPEAWHRDIYSLQYSFEAELTAFQPRHTYHTSNAKTKTNNPQKGAKHNPLNQTMITNKNKQRTGITVTDGAIQLLNRDGNVRETNYKLWRSKLALNKVRAL